MHRFATFAMAGLALLGVAAVCPAQFPDMIYYKFDEANGLNGATANLANPGVGNPNPIATNHTLVAGGGQFNGHLQAAATANAANGVDTGWQTNLAGGSWTLSFWADVSFAATGSLYYCFGDSTAGSFRSFYNGAAGVGNVMVRGGGLTDVIIPGAGAGGPHVVHFVRDATTNTVAGFLDGVQVASVPQGAPNIVGTGNLRVAGYTASSWFNGVLMDEFRLYSYALTPGEIAATWNAELFDVNKLEITQTGPGVGDLSISLTNLAPTATSGWMLLSADVAAPSGSGPVLGIYPDANTWLLLTTTPLGVGNPFHFPAVAPAGFFPNAPFVLGPGAVNSLTGLTVDVVMLMVNPGPHYDSKSNLIRFTFQ